MLTAAVTVAASFSSVFFGTLLVAEEWGRGGGVETKLDRTNKVVFIICNEPTVPAAQWSFNRNCRRRPKPTKRRGVACVFEDDRLKFAKRLKWIVILVLSAPSTVIVYQNGQYKICRPYNWYTSMITCKKKCIFVHYSFNNIFFVIY